MRICRLPLVALCLLGTIGIHSPAWAEANPTSNNCIVLSDPWGQYFRAKPRIFVINTPSSGILDLLTEQQILAKSVLDASGSIDNGSDFAPLEEKLSELKSLIPSAETASGYVPTRGRSYTYVSGNTIYTRTAGNYYYNGYYYRYLREKQKSSSPDLVRSVEGIVHNATLDLTDLDQRIEALQRMTSQWARRTADMSTNGTSGIIREANEAYLDSLRQFITEMIELRKEVRIAHEERQQIEDNKASIIANWRQFENTRLPVIHDYITQNAAQIIEASSDDTYLVPEIGRSQQLILACTIGERDLYFQLTTERSTRHPFVLVDLSPR